MSEQGKYASVIYYDDNISGLASEYIYYSTHDDIYPDPSSIIFNGQTDTNALIPDKGDVAFLSSYQETE